MPATFSLISSVAAVKAVEAVNCTFGHFDDSANLRLSPLALLVMAVQLPFDAVLAVPDIGSRLALHFRCRRDHSMLI